MPELMELVPDWLLKERGRLQDLGLQGFGDLRFQSVGGFGVEGLDLGSWVL